jgi:hypothetical protein
MGKYVDPSFSTLLACSPLSADDKMTLPSEADIKQYILSIVQCDARGKDQSSLCFGNDPNANAIRDRVYALLALKEDDVGGSGSPSASSGSSGLVVPVIAGERFGSGNR